jgi:hypothetical protein
MILLLAGCRKPSADVAAPVHADASRASVAKRSKRGGSDVTFFVVSDTHFGYGYPSDDALTKNPVKQPLGLEAQNKKVIASMNALATAGRQYPQDFGGTVAAPRGVVITGDLTEWGREIEWKRFLAYYGRSGSEALLAFPVFECVGNHDKVPGPWLESEVAKRHGGRFYAWDWDDLHVVSLGEAPDDEGIRFLERDLEALASDIPIVLYFHLALEGPWSTDNWFTNGDLKDRLSRAIAKNNVVAIFHGHHHANGHYVWRGVDVYKPGAVKDSTGTFAVAHYVDGRFDVAYYDYERDAWAWSHRKKVD